YTDKDLPATRRLSCPSEITTLNRIWDDDDPVRWNKKSPLYINGNNIALVYWPQLYRYRHFWATYSSQGQKSSLSTILKDLKVTRQAEDDAIAAIATAEYAHTFQQVFTYRRGSKTYVMSDSRAIARKYRSL
ncbi:hypothetical protein C8Q80DRAFT_1058397, partial [Daedaleopsis nitida]